MRFEIENQPQAEFLSMMQFEFDGAEIRKTINEEDREYLRGGWLEERLFLAVDAALPGGKDIHMNVMCEDPFGNRNEFDVLFTLENVLYLIECKSLGAPEGGENDVAASINTFLYKLGALRQNFGLTPRAFLATTSPDILDSQGNVKAHLIERGKQFSTEIIPLLLTNDLEQFFQQRFSQT